MNREEASVLLGHAAAFDNRRESEAAAVAWAAALHDIPLDLDTLGTVARYYSTPPVNPSERLWLQPHHVRALRRSIRSERAHGFKYVPSGPDEPVGRYLARLRGQITATIDGQAPPSPPRAIGRRPVAALAAGVGVGDPRGQQSPKRPHAGPLSRRCPTCQAPVGIACRKGTAGSRRRQPHPARRDAVRIAAGLAPESRETPAEIEARRNASAAWLAQHPQDT
ncbi:zinc finger domain-containing protein [Streptomyces xiamenensis]|uniref:zinc finger domain-containing protein n=1 Tax=Streptomyces xiamenensis TaxID=408015 RepID=UPI0037D3CC69